MSLHARSTLCSHDRACVSVPAPLQERLTLLRDRLERRYFLLPIQASTNSQGGRKGSETHGPTLVSSASGERGC